MSKVASDTSVRSLLAAYRGIFDVLDATPDVRVVVLPIKLPCGAAAEVLITGGGDRAAALTDAAETADWVLRTVPGCDAMTFGDLGHNQLQRARASAEAAGCRWVGNALTMELPEDALRKPEVLSAYLLRFAQACCETARLAT